MIDLSPSWVAALGIILFLGLIVIGVPIGWAMGMVGFLGVATIKGLSSALGVLYVIPYSAASNWALSVLPMFIFMGYVAFHAGFGKDAYDGCYRWVGRLPGGVAIATLMGGAAFGACCGSGIASTAALGKIAPPEMERFRYSRRLAAGATAMAGTLAALIPPSGMLVLYGMVTDQNMAKLQIAGLVPGLLSMAAFCLLVLVWVAINPKIAPKGESFTWRQRLGSFWGLLPILLIFVSVVGGLLSGIFTPTEAGAIGAFVTLGLSFLKRRMPWATFREALRDSVISFTSVFIIVISAYIFIQFLALSRVPIEMSLWVGALPIHPLWVLIGITVVYLILGCFLDAVGCMLLTVPFIFPIIMKLGFDPIWFGVYVAKMLEIGNITPPVGLQAFVLHAVAPHLNLSDIWMGFIPFFLVDLFLVIGLLIAFPQITLFLPSLMK